MYILTRDSIIAFTPSQVSLLMGDISTVYDYKKNIPENTTYWYNMSFTPSVGSGFTGMFTGYFSLSNDTYTIKGLYNYDRPGVDILNNQTNLNGAANQFVWAQFPNVIVSGSAVSATGGFQNICGGGINFYGNDMQEITLDVASAASISPTDIFALNMYGSSGSSIISGLFYEVANSYSYLSNSSYYDISYEQIPNNPFIPCFCEDSKILILNADTKKEEYVFVQDIRKGTLVKTSKDGYLSVDMIGKSSIFNPETKERIKTRLYKLSKSNYSDLFEDLILTGCHSILVDSFKDEEQKQKVIEVNNNIFVTDNKYRLPACVDERSEPFEKEGSFNIYHIALENENYYSNYGIYANGLLVESCSKRYLKELSKMTLLE